ncbi:prolyl oligopeptidase family serine peptidase [Candidatus Poriferisodalis sp.]|uniref:dipeptidyl-peptidase 5 n=1 Tax=Candidatus Poriferisodalis sp. TaxID=3101277 RepID=UPI003B0227F4
MSSPPPCQEASGHPDAAQKPSNSGIFPHGAWPSPLQAADVAAGAVRRIEPRVASGWAYWAEERPDDRGRGAIVRVQLDEAGAQPSDIAHTAEADIRTAVHEYGGGAWLPFEAPDGNHFVLASCMSDHRVRLFDATGHTAPRAVTPEPDTPRGLRYADPALVPVPHGNSGDSAFGPVSVWVREAHDDTGHDPRNELVAVRLDGTVTVVAAGADFYSSPRPSPDGSTLAYLCWDHPNMPWDHTRLHLVDLRDGEPVPGSDRVLCDGPALTQPAWSPDGVLHIVTDIDGWWSIHRVDAETGATEPVLDDAAAGEAPRCEFGVPAWVFAQATYGWDGSGTLWCTWMSDGVGHLGTIRDGRLEEIPSEFTDFGRLAVTSGGSVVTVAAGWTRRAAVVEIASDGTHRELSASEPSALEAGDVSVPQAFTFDSDAGRHAHAFFFPPANSTVTSPPAELPPLMVLSHGGPTGSARSSLDLGIQYWTSRGVAVVDVNYGGSTGYGTAFRNLLRGQWGVVDTQDCIAAALHLAQDGVADPERLVIKGGSAGGYTTLCALTGSDVFAAGISRYGVADLEALARDTHKFEARYLDGLIGPWPERADLYRERSPIWRTDQLRTPMIVLQGTEDRVVPQSQSEQVVAALADAGVPHAYLLFEGEGHGFRRGPNIVAALEAELSFLGQVLGFEPAGDIARVEVREGHGR